MKQESRSRSMHLNERDEAYNILRNILKSNGDFQPTKDLIGTSIRLCSSSERIVRKTGLPILLWVAVQCPKIPSEFERFITIKNGKMLFLVDMRSQKNQNQDESLAMFTSDINIKCSELQKSRNLFFASFESKQQVRMVKLSKLIENSYYGEMGWVPDPLEGLIWLLLSKRKKSLNLCYRTTQNIDFEGNNLTHKMPSFNEIKDDLSNGIPNNDSRARNIAGSIMLSDEKDNDNFCYQALPSKKMNFNSMFMIKKVERKRKKIEDFTNPEQYSLFKAFEERMIQRNNLIIGVNPVNRTIKKAINQSQERCQTSFKISKKIPSKSLNTQKANRSGTTHITNSRDNSLDKYNSRNGVVFKSKVLASQNSHVRGTKNKNPGYSAPKY